MRRMNPKISLVAAISENRALGKNNDLIFKIPEDLKRFRQLTLNHPIIMGRKTYESIRRPLPNRTNIIVSRDKNFKVEGAVVVGSLEEAIEATKKDPGIGSRVITTNAKRTDEGEIFIIGGGQIYEQAIKFADILYLTVIHQKVEDADVFFPDYSEFRQISKEDRQWNGIYFSYEILIK